MASSALEYRSKAQTFPHPILIVAYAIIILYKYDVHNYKADHCDNPMKH